MALTHRQKRRWSLVILLVALPAWVVFVSTVMQGLSLPKWAEALVYILSGLIWALPFKSVFQGVGQADPDSSDH